MKRNLNYEDIEIRKYIEKDFCFVYKLLKLNMNEYFERHWGGWSRDSFKSDFNKNGIRILECKKKKVGFVDSQISGKVMYVKNVQISKEMRGRGLGMLLMNYVEKIANDNEINKINLLVFKDNPAIYFYEKIGYKEIKKEKASLILEKILE